MRAARIGDQVKIDYTIMLDNGVVFETSKHSNPLTFTIGKGEVMPGVEKSVIGMKPGEKKHSILQPKEAFGQKREGITLVLDKSDLPDDVYVNLGQEVMGQHSNGSPLRLFVTDITDEVVTLDQNHPLAGKTVALGIEMLQVY
jgi:peptidylprolyl isomerase